MNPNNEAFDAEVAAIFFGLSHLDRRGQEGEDYTLFTDSRAAMKRITRDAPGPGQEVAAQAIRVAQ